MTGKQLSLYQTAVADRRQRHNAAIKAGEYDPFIYPWDSISALILFLAVLLVPSIPPRYRRIISISAFALICYLSYHVMVRTRTLNFGCGYGPGLACTWGMVMTLVHLVINEPKKDYVRLEQRNASSHQGNQKDRKQANGSVTSALETRTEVNGEVRSSGKASKQPNGSLDHQRDKEKDATDVRLVWQNCPTSLHHRVDWTLDLITSFRGVNWNFRLPTLPTMLAPPLPTNFRISPRFSSDRSKAPASEQPTIQIIRRQAITRFLIFYLIIDGLKTIMITDPYFLGQAPLTSPSPWTILTNLPVSPPTLTFLTKLLRLFLSLLGVCNALSLIFSLSPLFFATILPALLPFEQITRSPLLNPSLYPGYWANPLTNSPKSLGHLWGSTWHQMFRYGISEPSRYLIARLKLDPKSQTARIVQLGVAFGITATLHASASYTCFPASANNPPRPLSGPFLFFMLQAVGIITQTVVVKSLKPYTKSLPGSIGQGANLIFILIWAYTTGPLLTDDFARCGIWMFEPCPISIFRPIILVDQGEGWITWHLWRDLEDWVGWWDDERWWRRGIAII